MNKASKYEKRKEVEFAKIENDIQNLQVKSVEAMKALEVHQLLVKEKAKLSQDEIAEHIFDILFLKTKDTLLPNPIIYFSNETVISFLKKIGVTKHSLNRVVNLQEIVSELNMLSKIEGLYFFPFTVYQIIKQYLEIAFLNEVILDWGLVAKRDRNENANFIAKYLTDINRRVKAEKKGVSEIKVSSRFELDMIDLVNSLHSKIDDAEINSKEKKQLKSTLLSFQSKFFIKQLQFGYSEQFISFNELCHKTYDLFRLINIDVPVPLPAYDKFIKDEQIEDEEEIKIQQLFRKYRILRIKSFVRGTEIFAELDEQKTQS